MATSNITVHGTHLNGSVPLPDAETVFRTCLSTCPSRFKRIPDGETGERQLFTVFQAQLFDVYPAMMTEFVHNAPINNRDFTPEQVEEGIKTINEAGIETGYDAAAIHSYAIFRRLRDEGVIPKGVKFQVCLPTVTNVIVPFVQRAFQSRMEPIYEEALFRAVRRIQDEIPHEDLALQVDIAADTAFWEATNPETTRENSGLEWYQPWWKFNSPMDVKRYQTDYLLRWMAQVDEDVELGMHNCYGDMNHKHWHEPSSLAVVVERAKMILDSLPRKMNFFHCPVPKSAENHIDEYLAPLKELLPYFEKHGTDVYLGLVHEHEPKLTKMYIKAASKIIPSFGAAAECGGGRMTWPGFEDMLKISVDVSQPVL